MKDFEEIMKQVALKFTPEYLEELSKESYKEDREYPENFSNWYPNIIDFGEFKHSKIISNQIFTYDEIKIMQETDNIDKVNWKKINEILKPTLDLMKPNMLYNIKNGCFSNKFDFETCIATKKNLAEQLWKINYQSSMFETGGHTELVVRELIPSTIDNTHPTIYNGMPLREEVRVFYNIDKQEIEYFEDYWNYEYCRPNIRNKSDEIIFDYFHNKILGRTLNHQDTYELLCKYITKYIKGLKFNEKMTGIWSIDFLAEINHDNMSYDIYLIDMARGFRSAYWDPSKLKSKEGEQ